MNLLLYSGALLMVGSTWMLEVPSFFVHALLSGDFSAAQLGEYEQLFENSWAKDELWKKLGY